MTDEKATSKLLGRKPRRASGALAAMFALAPVLVAGEIFRYQDDQGNWHFTDDPPERYESSVVPGIATSKTMPKKTKPETDLASRLQSTFNPITPIAYATMAVVAIKNDSSEGSGFFCSEEGHILTNMHLVRPAPAENPDERLTALNEQEEKLQALETNVQQTRTRLESMKQDLGGYEELIEKARDEKTRTMATEAHKRLTERYAAERGKASAMGRNIRKSKTQLRDEKRKLNFKRSYGAPKTQFDIMLKDGTELVARLVETSDEQDLALLKLEGYRTPFLRLDATTPLSQGARVFAIGNPLGMQAAVSSGVVTQIAPEHLYTDAQILPGSSGGPLILENGAVIGISVARRVAAGSSKYAAGFGEAIPASVAVREFPNALVAAAAEAAHPGLTRTQDPFWGATFGPSGSDSPGASPTDESSSGPARSFGIAQPQIRGAERIGTDDSAPVRLILSNGHGDARAPEPTVEPAARTLDFPPEGGGLPPGISLPEE